MREARGASGMETPADSHLSAIRAQDIQTGLQDYQVPHFETLLEIGMAARLAIHIRGRDAVEYNVLKELAAYLFGVNKLAFPSVVRVLQEVDFVRIIGQESAERRIIPQVPYFDSIYQRLSEQAAALGLNEAERMSVEILNRLSRGPVSRRDIMRELDIAPKTADLILDTGRAGSYIDSFERSDGDEVLISPVYFSENPQELARVVERYGVEAAFSVLEAIRTHPGWPLAAIMKSSAIGSVQLHPEQVQLVQELVRKGVLQPPAIATTRSGTNHFLFTPPIGNERVRVVEKQIYEKAMALIAAVRQGQHFARYPIWSPRSVLKALLRDGWIRATTEAKEQWRAAALLSVCERRHVGGGWHQIHLIQTDENRKALRLALQLLDVGDVREDRGLDQQARLMLEGGETYQEMLRGLGSIKQNLPIPGGTRHATSIVDALLEQLQKG